MKIPKIFEIFFDFFFSSKFTYNNNKLLETWNITDLLLLLFSL
jgi:hypothetical protein